MMYVTLGKVTIALHGDVLIVVNGDVNGEKLTTVRLTTEEAVKWGDAISVTRTVIPDADES